MKILIKIKSVTEWILSWILKLRLRRTYWNIAVPAGIFVLGEFAKKLDISIKVTNHLYENTEGWSKLFWKAAHFYFSINLPWWSLILIIIMLLMFTYIYLEELKAKKGGVEITATSITDQLFINLSKKIDIKIEEIKNELTFQPDNTWFLGQSKASIQDLGKRYTPELNVKLEISNIFEGIGRTEEFKRKVITHFDQLLISGKKILRKEPELKESIENLEKDLEDLFNLFNNTEFLGTGSLPGARFEDFLHKIEDSVEKIYDYYLTEERNLQKEKRDYQFYHKYGSELSKIRDFKSELYIFQNLIKSSAFRLANNPFLLLDGEAGIGKSHLIGDVISRRNNKNYESIFLLGQHFVTEEDPWTQIFKRLQINTKAEDFLKKLNHRGHKTGKRILLFIDAINEGKGNYVWNSFIKSFIYEVKKYEWLGLILTVRTSYKDFIFPEEERIDAKIIEHHHYGFRNIEYEASKLFFENYKIELPNIPLLHPEFQNPLFLKLFCEGISKAGLSRIPDGLQGITAIINFFIKNINKVLSKPIRVGYSENLNLVEKSIYSLIEYKVDNNIEYVPYEMAYIIIDKSISKFVDKRGFVDELIVEGVLSKNLLWKEGNDYEDIVYLAYERFEDHLTAQLLLKKYEEIKKEFNKGGELHSYVKDENALYKHKGLIEAFAIQVPEKYGIEFHDLIPDFKAKYPIVESYVESLLWRKVSTVTEESKKYVNEYVFKFEATYDLFWETIIALTGIPHHFYNANSLHNHLIQLSLAERDANWTQFLKHKYNDDSSVKRLIDWAWSPTDKSHISDHSVKLSGITLAWFHTSTNRKLRDCSTKALISLLRDRLDVLKEILIMFENVNDPYIYERLYAVTYGCVLRTQQTEKLSDLSDYVFQTIFNDPKGVVPHILLRDYARGIIEYTHHLNKKLSFKLAKIRPPYQSQWPEEIPSYEELKEKYDNDQYRDLWSSVMGFGDFSRYTIGTNSGYSEWSNCKIGETPINREKIFKNFQKKLSAEQRELLKNLNPVKIIESEEGVQLEDITGSPKLTLVRKNEEELNIIRQEFKKSIKGELLLEYETELEPYFDHNFNIIKSGDYFDLKIAQRLILSRVMELGWDPEIHLSFDKNIGTGRGRGTTPHERIGKKYQWIAYYQFMALLSDNFIKQERWGEKNEKPYEGPWDPYVRDIDPTMLISKTGSYDEEKPEKFWWVKDIIFNWDCSNEEWVNNFKDLPEFENILQVTDPNNEEWLILEGFPSWSEPKKIGEEKWNQPQKELWCQIRSYLVKGDDFTTFKDWATTQHFMGRWMPESIDRYELFSREYYWSPAQEYIRNDYYGGKDWTDVNDKESGRFITKVNITTQGFLWEEEFDQSKEETIGFLNPSNLIFNGMKLEYSQKEGEFLNASKEVQCFAPNVYNDCKSYLLVKKAPFLTFLKKNNLKIIWTVLGEKQILGGRSFGKHYPRRMELSGIYEIESNRIQGIMKTIIN